MEAFVMEMVSVLMDLVCVLLQKLFNLLAKFHHHRLLNVLIYQIQIVLDAYLILSLSNLDVFIARQITILTIY
jgi:hypothetical protein